MKWKKVNESIKTNERMSRELFDELWNRIDDKFYRYSKRGTGIPMGLKDSIKDTMLKFVDDNPVVNHQMDESIDDESGWFDEYGNMVRDLPPECISACSHSGSCDDDVAFWVDELEFDKGLPVNLAKRWLKATGGWTDDEIEAWTTRDIAERVLWIVCGNLKEDPDNPIYLGDY